MVYELKQFCDPSELELVVKYLKENYQGAAINGAGFEYGANLLVKHAALTNHYNGLVSIGNPFVLEKA